MSPTRNDSDAKLAFPKTMKKIIFTLILSVSSFGFSSEISVMTFNVENLFDTNHDTGKKDFTFLPLKLKSTPDAQSFCRQQKGHYKKECLGLDWNDEVLDRKMKNLSSVILGANQGKGPDILMLVEVENDKVLTQFNQKYLKAAGYQTQVLIEGPDERGIDVALLSRLKKKGSPLLHEFSNNSRGILEVNLKTPNGSSLKVFIAHFPSQRNPRSWRKNYVDKSLELLSKYQNQMYIFGGDLNITTEEESETGFFKNDFSQMGLVAHLVACKKCTGTHKYRGRWSFLDTLIFSKTLGPQGTAPYVIDSTSFKVITDNKIHYEKGTPKRYDPLSGQGVSDHLPFIGKLKFRDEKPKTSLPVHR